MLAFGAAVAQEHAPPGQQRRDAAGTPFGDGGTHRATSDGAGGTHRATSDGETPTAHPSAQAGRTAPHPDSV